MAKPAPGARPRAKTASPQQQTAVRKTAPKPPAKKAAVRKTATRAAAPRATAAGDAPLGRQAQKAQLARDRIIGAVIALIKEGGFANATASRIAARAGMTWGAAQHHFGAKEDILDAILEMSHRQFSARMSDPALRGGALAGRVDRFVELMWVHYQDDLYLVALEILLAMRGFQRARPSRAEERHIRAHQKLMREIFSDSTLDDVQLREAMTFVHCFLTGLSVEHVFERKLRHVDRHLQRIKQALLGMVGGR
ncbi:TetR/AcrR family transcriptional regulator [Solimonas variicoloris]|uniref:TetR/AcrR family transcriptional regulator n=1 Tax=Solimonas variicoloris TaxID=254408 RepID=UPI000375D55A|nr:TetR/AcrR family transcriptional regulator [Solimonas variicoloris]